MSGFKDYFSSVSASYRSYRPTYPSSLFEYLADLTPSRKTAWDAATGNGQAARQLARHFDRVVASDASAEQIRHAEATEGVTFRVESAESSQADAASIDLITVAQALHWFDLPKFQGEVRRVAKPGAILAVWSYGILESTPAVDAVIESLYNGILGDYWTEERRIVERGYSDVRFDFEPLVAPDFAMRASWSLDHMLGYLSTWSAAKRYQERHGEDPIAMISETLGGAWGDPESSVEVAWPLAVRLWRVKV